MKSQGTNPHCPLSGKACAGNIIRHGFYKTTWGKRRRYRCKTCGRTLCSNAGTPYYRLQHRRTTFDEVAALSVEGLNKSAIARVEVFVAEPKRILFIIVFGDVTSGAGRVREQRLAA